jgi:hypothetical protein
MKNKSVPEPPPKPHGLVVPDELIKRLQSPALIALVKERTAFGMKKYGQPLMTEDGRDGVEDARQELGDLLQYVCKVALTKDPRMDQLMELIESAVAEMRKLK